MIQTHMPKCGFLLHLNIREGNVSLCRAKMSSIHGQIILNLRVLMLYMQSFIWKHLSYLASATGMENIEKVSPMVLNFNFPQIPSPASFQRLISCQLQPQQNEDLESTLTQQTHLTHIISESHLKAQCVNKGGDFHAIRFLSISNQVFQLLCHRLTHSLFFLPLF